VAVRRCSILRRSLTACTAEGAAAEVVGACCGGAALTGWALHLGMSPKLIGMVGALPVVAQVLQLLGAFLTARFGHKRTAICCIAISRQMFMPLALLPLLPLGAEGRRELLLVVAGAHHGLGIVANNAWNTWMGEMVPASLRGRYFGRRTAMCAVAGGVCGLAAGLALDRGQHVQAAGSVLQVLALVACVAGALSVACMSRQHVEISHPRAVSWALAVKPLEDPRARRLVVYAVAWNGACGLSAPFFGLYLLRDLATGYALFAAQGAWVALMKIASASAFGRAIDRAGSRRVLVLCTGGLVLSPLAWIACTPGRLWPLAIEAALGGLLFGGQTVASFALPLQVAPPEERPFYLAAVAVAGGAAFAATSAIGGAAVASENVSLRFLLGGSAILRVAAVCAALSLPPQGGEQPVLKVPLHSPAGTPQRRTA